MVRLYETFVFPSLILQISFESFIFPLFFCTVPNSLQQFLFPSPHLQAVFHFRVERGDDNRLLDDSRELALGPFELRLGKGFALGVWEDMVKTMSVGEKARFTVKPDVSTKKVGS